MDETTQEVDGIHSKPDMQQPQVAGLETSFVQITNNLLLLSREWGNDL
jgi:hypothetical protein